MVGSSVFLLTMPTRLLREGILTSERVNRLSPQAELFYRRLFSVADDYGRYFAHPALLRAACYPLKLDVVKDHHISGWLKELSESGLVVVYGTPTTKYLEIQDFRQRIRYDSKYPDQKTVLKSVLKTVSRQADPSCDTPTPTPTPTPLTTGKKESEEENLAGFERFWSAYPRKVGKRDAWRAWEKLAASNGLVDTIVVAVRSQAGAEQWTRDDGRYIPHPATWLNGHRWADVLGPVVSEAEQRKREILYGDGHR